MASASGSAGSATAAGTLPNAPQSAEPAVSASTHQRLLHTVGNEELVVFAYTNVSAGWFRFCVSALPLLCPARPICMTNFPAFVN